MAVVLAASACRGASAADTPPRDTFVDVNVALRLIPDTVADPDSVRRAVLEEHGVTEADLRRFTEAYGTDLEGLAEAWREVAARLDSLQQPPPPEEIPLDERDYAEPEAKPVDGSEPRLPPDMYLPHLEPPPGQRTRPDPPMRRAPPVPSAGDVPLPRPRAPMVPEAADGAPVPPKEPRTPAAVEGTETAPVRESPD